MITCSKCKTKKDTSKFRPDNKYKSGYFVWCRPCVNEYSKKYKKNHPKVKENYLKKRLKEQYNLEYNDYLKMVKDQQNRCKICDTSYTKFKRRLSVDHCHKTGKVRGLLCHHCNTGIGNLKDDIKLLENAISYLGGVK